MANEVQSRIKLTEIVHVGVSDELISLSNPVCLINGPCVTAVGCCTIDRALDDAACILGKDDAVVDKGAKSNLFRKHVLYSYYVFDNCLLVICWF